MQVHFIASGSRGNATVIEGTHNAVLIDCGITKKQLLNGLAEVNCDPGKITHMFITHEHTDHVKGFGVLMRYLLKTYGEESLPSVYSFPGTLQACPPLFETKTPITPEAVFPLSTVQCGDFAVTCLPASHDAAQPMNMRIDQLSGESLAFMTDTGIPLPETLEACAGAGIVALEFNHDPKMLQQGPYPYHVKKRIASNQGHLSNQQAQEALQILCGPQTKHIVGIHLSENNNTYDLAMAALQKGADQACCTASVSHAYQELVLSIQQ